MGFLEGEGLKLKTERGNRVFPESDKSSDVIKTLKKALEKRKVKIVLNTKVLNIEIKDGICHGVIVQSGGDRHRQKWCLRTYRRDGAQL